MATEYLECRQCKKKVAGWSQGIIRQLSPTYSCQFPAVLTYKLSCDLRVVGQLRSGPLGNSAKQLYNNLRELHSDSWMRRSLHYLGVCEQFFSSVSGAFAPPPPMPPVPSPACLLTVYGYDMVMRLEEYKALITSTFGTILKIYSSKEVSKKLASATSNADTWITSVGNEHGQVLMSVLTCSEGSEGLSTMAAGLMKRYRLADKPPPLVVYVDRDCCSRDGVSKTAALFHEWGNLVVRLDIWHYMRCIAGGVTTESHELYPTFMRQLSLCIFEVDPEDARRLKEAKRSELGREHGMFDLSDAEVIQRISKEEWRLHCRHRTRGAEQTALLIQNLLDTFRGPFFPPDPSLLLAASQTGSDEPRYRSPLDSAKGSGSQAPPREPPSDIEEEVIGPDGQPGYQHVLNLAKALVEARSLNGLRDSKVDMLISLWQRLPDADKQRQVEGKTTTWPSREPPAVSCSMKVNRTQPNRPESSRLVEATCSQLCRVHPSATRVKGILRTRWSLILADYVSIREMVLGSPRLMAETTIQLFPLNQRNISKWFIGRQKRWARPVLKPRPAVVSPPAAIQQAQLPEEEVLLVLVGHGQPYISDVSDVEPGPSSRGLPTLQPIPHQVQLPATLHLSANIQPLPGLPVVPRSTAYRKRKAAPGGHLPMRNKQYICKKCGQPKRLDTGHSRIRGVSYCAAFEGQAVEEWMKKMNDKGGM
ncbi:PREDICTED: uncharacterized protein LOC107099223 [Cyprinodon variegatus]|uniref:uncharacterized protein LOC107099223 n=1 Tax=Cyprinodon variegatus TaxID=28743 RepID=UPI000742836F|nr:PREDICTED: uncharacterized protein LOC107099223 [Cyprinodon variegatus]